MCRHVTDRPRIGVFSWCYHGSVDESFVTLDEQGLARARDGLVGPALDPTETTRVAEFNDIGSVERALEHGDVACLLMEPALTNIGIVLPEPGFMEAVRGLCTTHGTLLIIDETHTLSAGPGGCTAAWGLEPDAVTLGKSIGGGVPIGAYGVSAELAERIAAQEDADYEDTGGVGGTLAGNALSLAAARARSARCSPTRRSCAWSRCAAASWRAWSAPWPSTGCPGRSSRSALAASTASLRSRRAPARSRPPRTTRELEEYLHLYLMNRGVLITPFHNMALMCPATTAEQVDRHTEVFGAAVGDLAA